MNLRFGHNPSISLNTPLSHVWFSFPEEFQPTNKKKSDFYIENAQLLVVSWKNKYYTTYL